MVMSSPFCWQYQRNFCGQENTHGSQDQINDVKLMGKGFVFRLKYVDDQNQILSNLTKGAIFKVVKAERNTTVNNNYETRSS